MLEEQPLMAFTAFTANIDGLRGISQSGALSHTHLLHTVFYKCLGTTSASCTAMKHSVQSLYKYWHILFLQIFTAEHFKHHEMKGNVALLHSQKFHIWSVLQRKAGIGISKDDSHF